MEDIVNDLLGLFEQELSGVGNLVNSYAVDSDADVALSETLFPFQRAGAEQIVARRQVLIGDQMGLGKTLQALSGTITVGEYPVLVVCPDSLKGNWANEIAKWTDKTSQVLTGQKADAAKLTDADFFIIGYAVLAHWAPVLAGRVKALVLDESHYVKNPKAKRTQAIFQVREALAPEAPVVLLTGTPVLNRPIELITQLRLLGKFEEVAPRPRYFRNPARPERDWEFSYKFRFCGPQQNDFGKWDFKGTSNAQELADRLRSSCLVRRLKADVLAELPQKAPAISVDLSLNGKLNEYRRAVKALQEDIRDREDELGTAKAIVMINGLRKLAGEAKIESAVEWVQNFLDSNPDERIVVFAAHIDVQKALVEAFDNAPAILGGQSTDVTEAAKAEFNDGDARVIVCSLKAAREGHTLLSQGRCSNVAFVEMGWTPGEHQQAEDRIHRIGQENRVQAWYLLAADCETDQWLYELVQEKLVNITTITDGGTEAETTDSIVQEILRRFEEGR